QGMRGCSAIQFGGIVPEAQVTLLWCKVGAANPAVIAEWSQSVIDKDWPDYSIGAANHLQGGTCPIKSNPLETIPPLGDQRCSNRGLDMLAGIQLPPETQRIR